MEASRSLLQSYWKRKQHWKAALIVYWVQFFLAATVGITIYTRMKTVMGNSISLSKLKTGFDYTIISDFLSVSSGMIAELIQQVLGLVLIYLLISVFLQAGILSVLSEKSENGVTEFCKGGAYFFLPFFKIGLFFWTITILWTGVLWLPIITNMQKILIQYKDERVFIWVVIGILVVYFVGLWILFAWSLLGRIYYIQNGVTIFKGIKQGLSIFLEQWKPVFINIIAFLLLNIVVGAVYFGIINLFKPDTFFFLLLMFIIQQVFILGRIIIRFGFYSSFLRLSSFRSQK